MLVSIYAMADPRTMRIKYVGRTVDLKARIAHHQAVSSSGAATAAWISELRERGLKPIVLVLEEAEEERGVERETAWIQMFSVASALLNYGQAINTSPLIRHDVWVKPEVSEKLRAISAEKGVDYSELARASLEVGAHAIFKSKDVVGADGWLAARAFASFGASKGGKASAASLTPEQRRERGRNAVMARWAKRKAPHA